MRDAGISLVSANRAAGLLRALTVLSQNRSHFLDDSILASSALYNNSSDALQIDAWKVIDAKVIRLGDFGRAYKSTWWGVKSFDHSEFPPQILKRPSWFQNIVCSHSKIVSHYPSWLAPISLFTLPKHLTGLRSLWLLRSWGKQTKQVQAQLLIEKADR